jgi:hypothetical protein
MDLWEVQAPRRQLQPGEPAVRGYVRPGERLDDLDSVELVDLQIRLEYNVDTDGLLVPFPGSIEQARFIVYHHAEGYVEYFRHDLPRPIREQIAALPPEQALNDHEAVKYLLATDAPREEMWTGKSYVFATLPGPGDFPDAVREAGRYVVMVAEKPVSWAWSARENDGAAELAVETAPPFRRRRHGRQTAAAWGHHVLKRGKVAFYSHASDNLASEALAQSLGLVQFATAAAYE